MKLDCGLERERRAVIIRSPSATASSPMPMKDIWRGPKSRFGGVAIAVKPAGEGELVRAVFSRAMTVIGKGKEAAGDGAAGLIPAVIPGGSLEEATVPSGRAIAEMFERSPVVSLTKVGAPGSSIANKDEIDDGARISGAVDEGGLETGPVSPRGA